MPFTRHTDAQPGPVNDTQLLRYSRQILLPQVDVAGQQRLLGSTVLIIGLGGLGSPAAMYLAAAGVGRLILCDFDQVDLPNLQRQIAHRSADIGRAKVASAADTLRALNPEVEVVPLALRMDEQTLAEQVDQADVVVDASDNFATRFAINAACVRQARPLVSGAAIRFEGQVSVFRLESAASPCYRCLYPPGEDVPEGCTEGGVISPLVGVVGSLQALETLKLLLGAGETLDGRLLLLDTLAMEWRCVRLRKDPSCPVCSTRSPS